MPQSLPQNAVLVCVTASPHAGFVVKGGLDAAQALNLSPIFVHVGEDTAEQRGSLQRTYLEPVGCLDCPLIIRNGRPDKVICDVAREVGAALVFAGALEQEGIWRDVMGSTARRVARRAPCAVMLMVTRPRDEGVWSRVAAAINFDEDPQGTVRVASALARSAGRGALSVIREYDPLSLRNREVVAGEDADAYPTVRAATERSALISFLEDCALPDWPLQVDCRSGKRGSAILRYLQEAEIDLLVIAAPSQPMGLLERFFGHPAERILQRLPCSVYFHRSAGRGGRQ